MVSLSLSVCGTITQKLLIDFSNFFIYLLGSGIETYFRFNIVLNFKTAALLVTSQQAITLNSF